MTKILFGQYCIDIYISQNQIAEPQYEEFDDLNSARSRAEKLTAAGRFKYVEIYRWCGDDDYEYVESHEAAK